MGKNKLKRFAELGTLERVFQPEGLFLNRAFEWKGQWNETVFKNTHPLILELGCGKGEYTVNLAKQFPEKNFIGIDRKGARIWRGAKTVNEENILNAAFLRIQIQQISAFFGAGEVAEIWITFPDPQPQKTRENLRLTSARFLDMYREMLQPGGCVHLKTDNRPLYEYTLELAGAKQWTVQEHTHDLYAASMTDPVRAIRTTYESRFLELGHAICYLKITPP